MKSNQRMRKRFLIARSTNERAFASVLDALRRHDPASTAATLPAARASREIVRHLWDTLPDESEAFVFASPRDLVSRGAWCLDRIANPAVTLHLGWDDMCFRSTL